MARPERSNDRNAADLRKPDPVPSAFAAISAQIAQTKKEVLMKMNYVSSALAVAALFTSTITFAADGIEALDQAWRQAITANDLNGIVACYARGAVGS